MRKVPEVSNLGYERKPADLYETREEWITEGLIKHIVKPPFNLIPDKKKTLVWEPACGSGKMAKVLNRHFYVSATDLYDYGYGEGGHDFFEWQQSCVDAIITNPPYSMATEFLAHALKLIEPIQGVVCMLMRQDFDSASTRKHLFEGHSAFAKKLTLTSRPWWFEKKLGDKQPFFNYAWYCYSWKHTGPPTLGYIHKPKGAKS